MQWTQRNHSLAELACWWGLCTESGFRRTVWCWKFLKMNYKTKKCINTTYSVDKWCHMNHHYWNGCTEVLPCLLPSRSSTFSSIADVWPSTVPPPILKRSTFSVAAVFFAAFLNLLYAYWLSTTCSNKNCTTTANSPSLSALTLLVRYQEEWVFGL